MKCTFLGTGSAVNTARRHNTSLFLQQGDDWLLVDCNGVCVQRLCAIDIPFEKLEHIFLTHRHIDHIGALAVLLQQMWVVCKYGGPDKDRSAPLNIYANAETAGYVRRLFEALDVFAHPGIFPIELHTLDEAGGQLAIGRSTYQYFPVRHGNVPCFGLRTEYEGCGLTYSADTQVTDIIYEGLKDGDILIHECNSIDQAQSPAHTTWAELEGLIGRLPDIRLHLVHLPPVTQAREEEFTAYLNEKFSGKVVMARDGMEITL